MTNADETKFASPIFAYQNFGPLFSVSELAQRMAEPGIPNGTIESQLRRWAQQGLIIPREKRGSGRTASNLFDCNELGIAKILSELTDLGIEDVATLRSVSECLYAGYKGGPKRTLPHPITAAIVRWHQSPQEWLTVTVDTYRHTQTGERRVVSGIVNAMAGEQLTPEIDGAWHPKASVLLQANPIFDRIFRNIFRPHSGN
jgi:hypothetical protein